MSEVLINKVKEFPNNPGVYKFIDKFGKIIYVGKAKNLRKRVVSYFSSSVESIKTKLLLKNTVDIDIVVLENETDALLLENSLIKANKPRYNVLLKDDKTFPWICIKNEDFPRVFPTRKLIKDGSIYFGPYTNVKMMRIVLNLIKQLYKLRTCNYLLNSSNIQKNKFKVCLEYHISNCLAPCVGLQNREDYNLSIEEIKSLLKGNYVSLLAKLKLQMKNYATDYLYEKANEVKEKIDTIEKFNTKAIVVNEALNDLDVYSIIEEKDTAFVNILRVSNGAIIFMHSVEVKKKLNESKEDILLYTIIETRNSTVYGVSSSKEIIVPFKPEFDIPGAKYTIPVKGDKLKLLELSSQNANFFRLETLRQKSIMVPRKGKHRVMELMKKELKLNEWPVQIECFDNSNIQGEHAVASCVVFKDLKPDKSEYRHFNIKTVEGINDFASMEEIVHRRYSRALEEGKSLPQLIVIDGGKGQLSSACNSLKQLGIFDKVKIIGIAKRLEEIFFPDDAVPLYLNKNSETLKVIQYIRNEAHRFGITHHRNKRSKSFLISEIENIPGIGEKTFELLMNNFKTVEKIKNANFDELKIVIGAAKSKIILDFFENKNSSFE